jgi:hypothetical protein
MEICLAESGTYASGSMLLGGWATVKAQPKKATSHGGRTSSVPRSPRTWLLGPHLAVVKGAGLDPTRFESPSDVKHAG